MKTVQVKPQVVYANGKRMIATQLNVTSVQDNLFDHVIFKYVLLDESGQWAGESTYALVGLEQYQTWFATPEGAFEIVAVGIGLEIVLPEGESKVQFVEVA
jgi:hypothetical protein